MIRTFRPGPDAYWRGVLTVDDDPHASRSYLLDGEVIRHSHKSQTELIHHNVSTNWWIEIIDKDLELDAGI